MSFWILCGGVLLGKPHRSEPGREPALLTGTPGEPLLSADPVGSQPLGKLLDDY